jgi:hypothetical protein
MKHQTTAQPTQIDQPKTADVVHYPELNDAELEVVCGGGAFRFRNRSSYNIK